MKVQKLFGNTRLLAVIGVICLVIMFGIHYWIADEYRTISSYTVILFLVVMCVGITSFLVVLLIAVFREKSKTIITLFSLGFVSLFALTMWGWFNNRHQLAALTNIVLFLYTVCSVLYVAQKKKTK